MIAHVAEASENRGRVVLALGGGSVLVPEIAITAASAVAQAFHAAIESVLIEDAQWFDYAAHDFVREVQLSGRMGATSVADMERSAAVLSAALIRRAAATAEAAGVPMRTRIVRGGQMAALAAACADSGPWNMVALCEPLDRATVPGLRVLLSEVESATAVVVTGRRTRHASGPVIAIVDQLERAVSMARAADRLATITGGGTRIVLVADDAERLAWLDAQVRLAIEDGSAPSYDALILDPSQPSALMDAIGRARPGFVVIACEGGAASEDGVLGGLAETLDCPLLVVR